MQVAANIKRTVKIKTQQNTHTHTHTHIYIYIYNTPHNITNKVLHARRQGGFQ